MFPCLLLHLKFLYHLQFDFARLGSSKYYCPWRVPPVAINDQNVATRSAMLLDQYRKKSKLFKSDTLLVILGDDFRYDNVSFS